MSESSTSIPVQQPGYGYSMYHESVFGALVRELENYNAVWQDMEERCKPHGMDMRIAAGFDEIEEAAIPVILAAHAMVEELANWFLALNCTPDRFREIEPRGPLRKWTEFVKECIPGYDLPSNDELYRDLSALIERRKAVTHHKPLIEANNREVHPGDHRTMASADKDFVRRIASLPERLLEHILRFKDDPYLHIARFGLDDKRAAVLRQMRWRQGRAVRRMR